MKKKFVILLQARMSSKRFPKKILKHINNIPIVVLSAKRASNTGGEVIVLTSTNSSDDELVEILKKYNIRYFRGDLKNVLKRFVDAIKSFDDTTPIFRLTADNVFPDGRMLDLMHSKYILNNYEYLTSIDQRCGVPYGLNAEIMLAKHLRKAHKISLTEYEREHVTPKIKEFCNISFFDDYSYLDANKLRSTIDYERDYKLISKVFREVRDPIQICSTDLTLILKKLS
jgi:spore coat polysaccharide biosynthesis protein SpsF